LLERKYQDKIVFDLKFGDNSRKLFYFEDPDSLLQLVKTPLGSDYCNSCWDDSFVADYDNWVGKSKYTKSQAISLVTDKPFHYNPFSRSCEANCDIGYWSSSKSIIYQDETPFDYRCVYDSCKNWDHTDNSPDNSSKRCTECWDAQDVQYYFRWHAMNSYTESEVFGTDRTTPFILENNTCKINCKTHYWSNSH